MRVGRTFFKPCLVGKCWERSAGDYVGLAFASLGSGESWEGCSSSVVSGNRQDIIFAYLLPLRLVEELGPKYMQ